MAQTIRTLVGTGSPTVYDIDFDLGYLRQSHIFVYQGDHHLEGSIPFTWVNRAQIMCSVPNSEEFFLRRVAPRNQAINDYTDGAVLRESNLDASFAQSLMIQEEVADGFINVDDPMQLRTNLDMVGNRVINVGDAVDPTDAVTKKVTDALAAHNALQDDHLDSLDEYNSAQGDLYNTKVDRAGDTMTGTLQIPLLPVGAATEALSSHAVLLAIDNMQRQLLDLIQVPVNIQDFGFIYMGADDFEDYGMITVHADDFDDYSTLTITQ